MRTFAGIAAWVCVSSVQAIVVIDTVTVGDPGNPDDTEGDGYGGVDYIYNMGKFEVTAGEYTEFLNVVAAEDTYGLYSQNMADPDGQRACNIQQSGAPGTYTYSVAADWADRPVNYVSWGDAARFANWLHNGQPTGPQALATTEDGAYYLDGATSHADLLAVVRKPDARVFLPSEDEWYKAAYYDAGANAYYDYPMGTDAVPDNGNPEGDTGNSANFFDGDYTIGSPYWRTEVGFLQLSGSPYGTYDQGGNLWEWDEAVIDESFRGLRGGSFGFLTVGTLHASSRYLNSPALEDDVSGFRVAEVVGAVPAISATGTVIMTLLLLGVGALILRRERTSAV